MKRSLYLTALLLNLSLVFCFQNGSTQEAKKVWTSSSGKSINATLRDIDPGEKTVTLLREDGAEFKIPISSLSLDDQAYLQKNLSKFAWTSFPALDPADPQLKVALREMQIEDKILVKTLKKERPSDFEITRVDPVGYRERHLCSYDGEIPQRMAIDNQGNLVFLTLKTTPAAIQRISPGGTLATIYETPETADSRMNTPVIGDQCQVAAIPKGGFFLRARWKEVFQKNGNTGYKSRLDYFTMQIRGASPSFTPHFSEVSLPSSSKTQTLEAFAGDRLITLDSQIGLYDMPKSSTRVEEHKISSRSDTSWSIKLFPLQVISENRVLSVASRSGFRIVFLVDFAAKTFAPIGSIADTEEERDSQLGHIAVSPDGRHLVYYHVAEKAFKRLEIAN